MSLGSAPSLFGASAVDFARCLQVAQDAGCFAVARIQTRAVGEAATAPGAPINLSTSSSGSNVTLTWNAPASGDPVITYIIEAGSAPGLSNVANFATNSIATGFSAGGVGAGTYYVRLRAQNAGGTSVLSNESILIVGSTGCLAAPNSPANLAGTTSGSTVTLTWSASSGGCAATSYVLQAGSAAGLSNLANSNTGSTATTYVATGVGGGTYFVRVAAANGNGQSGASNEIVVTVGASPGPNASGRWIGLAPDGVLLVPEFDLCDTADDVQLDLTQTGTTLSGTITLRTRSVDTVNCRTTIGFQTTAVIDGTVSGTDVSFGSGHPGLIFSGVVSGNRMSGFVAGDGDRMRAGTFAVTLQ